MNKKNQVTKCFQNSEQQDCGEFLSMFKHPISMLSADGKVVHCNESMLEVYGFTRNELIHANLFELCRSKNLTPPRPDLHDESPQTITLIQGKDDNPKIIQWTASKISSGSFQNLILIEGFDVTECSTRSINENFEEKAIIDLIPNHYIFWKDTNSVYLGCNQAFASAVGLSSCADVIGKTDYDLPTSKEQSDAYREDDFHVMETGQPKLNIEEYQTLSDGKTRVLSTSKIPLFDNQGKVYGVLAVYSDITERKYLELCLEQSKNLAEAANNAKTEFLANMRHDIRTPLSGIVGFSEILKSESNEPHIKEYANNLVASSYALLNLMDEVLEAIKVGSGEIPKLKRKFNLSQTFEEVMTLYSAKAHAKRLKLIFNMDKKVPTYVIGDKIRLHRIALELVGNALNFTDLGQVVLAVELAKRHARNLVIKITVTDTGMGIPLEKQQEIYVQFKRLTPSYQGIYKGAGLGLYVVKQFIEELDGEIYVESEPHNGTCFTCLIPLHESLLDDDFGIDMTENFKTEQSYVHSFTHRLTTSVFNDTASSVSSILIVEDNLVAQSVARTLLSRMCCRVDIASNGDEALELCKKNQYDIIFMDIGLGKGMNGYETSHLIRKWKGKADKTPIIALTAHASDENRQRCIDAGMDAVLTKPLTQARVVEVLKMFIPDPRTLMLTTSPSNRYDLPDKDEELFQLEQFALFDVEEALKNCNNNYTMLVDLLTLMVTQELPFELEEIKKAFADEDFSTVEKIAHKIKGSAVYVGATRMKYACQYVERYWKSGERELFSQLYHQAIKTMEESCNYIMGWLEKWHNP